MWAFGASCSFAITFEKLRTVGSDCHYDSLWNIGYNYFRLALLTLSHNVFDHCFPTVHLLCLNKCTFNPIKTFGELTACPSSFFHLVVKIVQFNGFVVERK